MRNFPFALLLLFTACSATQLASNPSRDLMSTAPDLVSPRHIKPSDAERTREIGMARTLNAAETDLSNSITEGPPGPFTPPWNDTVHCKFVEPVRVMGGLTPKFLCETLMDGKAAVVRVKYQNPELLPNGRSSEENEGIWGEILSSRLMWRMGVFARKIYPVHVICENCPPRPWQYIQALTEPQLDPDSAAEIKKNPPARLAKLDLPLAEVSIRSEMPLIETFHDQGWTWQEFAETKSPDHNIQIEHEALALLAAFLQHADNKAEQQELRCLDKGSPQACNNPMMMIADLGMTFGGGYKHIPTIGDRHELRAFKDDAIDESAASLRGFASAPIWADPAHCITFIRYKESTGVPANFAISEPARQLFLQRIGRLSDQDILELFNTARIELRGEKISGRPVTARDWLPAFKARIEKVRAVSCPQ